MTGEALSKRPDDCPDVFRVRMQQHKVMADPLLNHYHKVAVTVRGNTSDEIYPQIEREIVNRLGVLPDSTTTSTPPLTADVVAKYHQRQQHFDVEQRVAGSAQ